MLDTYCDIAIFCFVQLSMLDTLIVTVTCVTRPFHLRRAIFTGHKWPAKQESPRYITLIYWLAVSDLIITGDKPNFVQYKRNLIVTYLLDYSHIIRLYRFETEICTTENLLRSTAHGPSMARQLNTLVHLVFANEMACV